jgi:hypothetical protein
MNPFISSVITFLALSYWLCGYHIVWPPTEDQIYGCNVEQQAPNGECR